ncbi:glucose-6-phosphate isomerase [Lysinibacillus fusiformis]|uniref:Glucose-6-phosphate isomerase n=1 Tax=Lysinibacillus fusiformis TaxID=28031 RepID=A0A1H9M1U8_9BACI|nr:glucose-6-phosphate isomerase [Lysinibacillus fusiformis]SCY58539.1 glucose-6-phosphate isomerase [Lysinibacillus fusiformis]SEO15533.1 glucose-6-phosphate isomerase [Lysinibacillus fusiformis]SER17666.1 glucose-6-phosphate isomerase [Lysinibacillus fusiformis]
MIKYTHTQILNIPKIELKQIPELFNYINRPTEEYLAIQRVANEVNQQAGILLVIGVGGSFLGARAVIDACTPYFRTLNGVEIVYAGQNMSGSYLKQLLTFLDSKDVYVNVISKSGSTMETALAFRIVKQYMEERYGFGSKQRIIVTTDANKGTLKQIAEKEGYRQFEVPTNVGGRYSVFTAVGLLPMAVAGIDIYEFVRGGKQADQDHSTLDCSAYQYALTRFELYKQGYAIELLASFEPRLNKLHEWWKQLFGESEGKELKGLYPSTVNYSTDLHAIGQFIQEGSRIMFETLIHFENIEGDIEIPFSIDNIDGLNYLAGRSMNSINSTSKDGVALAHEDGGVPVIHIELPKLDAYHVGYLMMFFMKACVISANLLEVNPFDQPGVEAYKKKMLELLKEDVVKVRA